jgi:hypothetical protein
MLNVNTNPTPRELRKFALTMLIGMPVVGAIWTGIIWWSQDVLNPWILAWFSALGVSVCILTFLSQGAGRKAYIGWHTLAALIEAIISLLSTFIMYWLTIVPIGLVMRLFGRKPLPLTFDRSTPSYWKEYQEPEDIKRYFRQY